MTNGIDYNKLNEDVQQLISQGVVNPYIGTAKEPVPVKIHDVNNHAFKHGVTLEEAQGFIDNSVVMFDQSGRSLFVSHEGNAVVLDAHNRLISAYRKESFDPGIRAILEVL